MLQLTSSQGDADAAGLKNALWDYSALALAIANGRLRGEKGLIHIRVDERKEQTERYYASKFNKNVAIDWLKREEGMSQKKKSMILLVVKVLENGPRWGAPFFMRYLF